MMIKLQAAQSFVVPAAPSRRRQRARAGPSVWPLRLVDRFRGLLVCGALPLPSRPPPPPAAAAQRRASRGHQLQAGDPRKRRCGSYLSPPDSRYDEAISDCIEFCNQSFQFDDGSNARNLGGLLIGSSLVYH